MKIDSLKKKYNFSQENLDKIKAAVEKAEKGTQGELAVCVTDSSSFYTLWELGFAFLAGIIAFAIMIPFSDRISGMLQKVFWMSTPFMLPLFLFCVTLCVIVLVYLILNTPFFDRLIVPSKVMNSYVQNKALRHFVLSNVYATKKNTGVLIFVSVLERKVQVVCDKGILNSTEQSEWDRIAAELAAGFSRQNPSESIISSINKCGELFAENFPLKENEIDENELPDGIVFIEGGEL